MKFNYFKELSKMKFFKCEITILIIGKTSLHSLVTQSHTPDLYAIMPNLHWVNI